MISEFEKNNIASIGTRFFFITKPDSGVLSEIARKISANLIEHTPNISGRFSSLTNVTTLTAAIAGVKVEDYIDGAEEVIQDFLLRPESNEAVLSAAAIFSTNKLMMVNIGYLQQFSSYLEWYSQIIGESLGKNGSGITPLRGLGPNDQHSMLQLYLDGPQDKIFTMFYVQNLKDNTKTCSFEELGYIAEKRLSDNNAANFLATESALISKNLPTRTILLQDLSSRSIGSLVAHSMLEIVTLSHMMNINPFNQPGVELIKTKAKQLIATSLYSELT
jgi:glucose-6-phosphate isomerase